MVTFSRYITLIVYGVITYFLFSILSSITSIQALWYSWANLLHKTFNTSNFAPLYGYATLLFLAGLAVNKIADSFSIYNSKRYWQFHWRYPSLMLSVTCTIAIWFFFESKTTSILFSLDLVPIYLPILGGLIFLPALEFLKVLIRQKITPLCIDDPKNKASTRHIAKQIQETLCDEKSKANSKRILICGAFGVGKTTAINLAVDELKNKKELPKLVHCNIDLWGVEAESIIQYVLDEVLIALSTEIDMCKFRSLPSHYISAMNAGNTSSKIFAAFMHKPTSPDALLKSLSDVINAANLRLLVTVQDLDRNAKALDSLHALAGLLDRLEELQGIDYIFAGENRPEFSDTLLRICPIRFDFSKPNFIKEITELENKLIDNDTQMYYQKVLLKPGVSRRPLQLINKLLPSFRALHTLEEQIKSAWLALCGEVLFYDLVLLQVLKNNNPSIYDALIVLLNNTAFKSQPLDEFITDNFSREDNLDKELIKACLEHFRLIDLLLGIKSKETNISKDRVPNHVLSFYKHEHISRSLIGGRLENSKLKQRHVFKTLNEISSGDSRIIKNQAITDLCAAVENDETSSFWLDSIERYGWCILYNEIEDETTAKKLFEKAINVRSSRKSFDLLTSFAVRDYKVNPSSAFMNYLFSERIINDLFEQRTSFTYGTLFAILKIYSSFSSFGRSGSKPKNYKVPMNNLILQFINGNDSVSQANLLYLFSSNAADVPDLVHALDKATLNEAKSLIKNIKSENTRVIYSQIAEAREANDDEFEGIRSDALKFILQMLKL
ncbi:P-loop NTPase fold protein [Pseudoalteromonas sp. Z1A8]|uniref:P-loop NTPase fold protein n=1 Tax=Pseudoalteromonas sp. Z1A8 TaxID=2686354 RepID=UPI00140D627A|nr:P-loop NTPase fold protein [Pseudoalteromonas sp. Z1A8]